MNEQEKLTVAECEKYGPAKVRRYVTMDKWVGQKAKYAKAWLDHRDRLESDAAGARQEELASEANRIAREANQIARSARDKAQNANTIAKFAIAVAIISAIIMAIIEVAQAFR